jgi:hypothetical protein
VSDRTSGEDTARRKWVANGAKLLRKKHGYVLRTVNHWLKSNYVNISPDGTLTIDPDIKRAIDEEQAHRRRIQQCTTLEEFIELTIPNNARKENNHE